MKNQFKLLLVASVISLGMFACKGTVDSGDAGTTAPGTDTMTTSKDSYTDTTGKNTNIVTDTTKMNAKPVDTAAKK